MTMFEKEAEEYAGQSCFTEMSNPSLSESIDISDYIKEAVMFGYNKANEWHYVKDGDLPKDDNDVLVLLKDETMQVDYYFPKIGWNLSCKADVIAWKEIVLPELKE